MMKKAFLLILLLIGLGNITQTHIQAQSNNLFVKLTDTLVLSEVQKINTSLTWNRVFPYSEKFEKRHQENGLHLWYATLCSQPTNDLKSLLLATKGVKYAFYTSDKVNGEIEKSIPVEVSKFRSNSQSVVNDPLYPKQWHYQNRLYPNGIDINLEKAWELEKGSRDVIVAIMDSPFDTSHEDYKDNVWVNEKELNGKENVDDDGNGFIDDIYGYTFDNKTSDHGTHVAGTIAAINNNGIGVCGIAGGNGSTTGVKIMKCSVLGFTTDEDFANAFVYAADHGAVISQNSYKVEGSPLITEGINYFMKNAGDYEGSPMKGGLVVWAASNDNIAQIPDPLNDKEINRDNLIIVSSVGPDGDKTCYTNYGDWVNIAAPGGEFNKQGILSTITKNRYGYMQGTSMACPHVSGIAALVVSKFKGKITAKDVKHRIITSVNDVNRYTEGQKCWQLLGNGIADTWKALLDNQNQAPAPVSKLWVNRSSSNFIDLAWEIPTDADDYSIDSCSIYYSDSPFTEVNEHINRINIYTGAYAVGDTMHYRFTSPKANTSYYFKIQGKDRWGNLSTLSEAVTCKTEQKVPIIYGEYLFNNFNVYLPYEGNKFNPDPLTLHYKVLAPENMQTTYKVEDSGKGIEVKSFKNNELELEITSTGLEPKFYEGKIIVFDKTDVSLSDTLTLSYHVKQALVFPIPGPKVRPNMSLNFIVDNKKGSMDLNLMDYIEDPNEMGLYFEYDSIDNTEQTEFNAGFSATITDSLLHIDYEFPENYASWGDIECKIPFTAMNYQYVSQNFKITILYKEATGIEKVEKTDIELYPNPVENILNIQSQENIRQIYIYSVNGYMVYQQKNPGAYLDLSHLSSGNYFMQIITSNQTIVKKIIKK